MFKSCGNKGFHLTFKNGLTLSTQYGPGNYADNYDADFNMNRKEGYESTCAEVAVFENTKKGAWKTKEVWRAVFNEELNDDVVARVSFENWLKVVDYLKTN